jgi:SNF2 family DNA or RNA helicase
MLDQLEIALRVTGFTFQRIDGSQSLGDRSLAMKTFGEDSSCTVMLATIGSAAEGCVIPIILRPLS